MSNPLLALLNRSSSSSHSNPTTPPANPNPNPSTSTSNQDKNSNTGGNLTASQSLLSSLNQSSSSSAIPISNSDSTRSPQPQAASQAQSPPQSLSFSNSSSSKNILDLLNSAPNRLTSPPQPANAIVNPSVSTQDSSSAQPAQSASQPQPQPAQSAALDPSQQLLALLGGAASKPVAQGTEPAKQIHPSQPTPTSHLSETRPDLPSVSDASSANDASVPKASSSKEAEKEEGAESDDSSVIVIESKSAPAAFKKPNHNHLDTPVKFSDSNNNNSKPVLSALHHLSQTISNETIGNNSGWSRTTMSNLNQDEDEKENSSISLTTLDLRFPNPGNKPIYPAKLETKEISMISNNNSTSSNDQSSSSSPFRNGSFPVQKVNVLGNEDEISCYLMSKGRIRLIDLNNGNRTLLLVPGKKEIKSLFSRNLRSGGFLVMALIEEKNKDENDEVVVNGSGLIWKVPSNFGSEEVENGDFDHTKPIGGIRPSIESQENYKSSKSRFSTIHFHPTDETTFFLVRNDGKVLRVRVGDCLLRGLTPKNRDGSELELVSEDNLTGNVRNVFGDENPKDSKLASTAISRDASILARLLIPSETNQDQSYTLKLHSTSTSSLEAENEMLCRTLKIGFIRTSESNPDSKDRFPIPSSLNFVYESDDSEFPNAILAGFDSNTIFSLVDLSDGKSRHILNFKPNLQDSPEVNHFNLVSLNRSTNHLMIFNSLRSSVFCSKLQFKKSVDEEKKDFNLEKKKMISLSQLSFDNEEGQLPDESQELFSRLDLILNQSVSSKDKGSLLPFRLEDFDSFVECGLRESVVSVMVNQVLKKNFNDDGFKALIMNQKGISQIMIPKEVFTNFEKQEAAEVQVKKEDVEVKVEEKEEGEIEDDQIQAKYQAPISPTIRNMKRESRTPSPLFTPVKASTSSIQASTSSNPIVPLHKELTGLDDEAKLSESEPGTPTQKNTPLQSKGGKRGRGRGRRGKGGKGSAVGEEDDDEDSNPAENNVSTSLSNQSTSRSTFQHQVEGAATEAEVEDAKKAISHLLGDHQDQTKEEVDEEAEAEAEADAQKMMQLERNEASTSQKSPPPPPPPKLSRKAAKEATKAAHERKARSAVEDVKKSSHSRNGSNSSPALGARSQLPGGDNAALNAADPSGISSSLAADFSKQLRTMEARILASVDQKHHQFMQQYVTLNQSKFNQVGPSNAMHQRTPSQPQNSMPLDPLMFQSLVQQMSSNLIPHVHSAIRETLHSRIAEGIADSLSRSLPYELSQLLQRPDISIIMQQNISKSFFHSVLPSIQKTSVEIVEKVLEPHFEQELKNLTVRIEGKIQSEMLEFRKGLEFEQSETLKELERNFENVHAGFNSFGERVRILSDKNAKLEKTIGSLRKELGDMRLELNKRNETSLGGNGNVIPETPSRDYHVNGNSIGNHRDLSSTPVNSSPWTNSINVSDQVYHQQHPQQQAIGQGQGQTRAPAHPQIGDPASFFASSSSVHAVSSPISHSHINHLQQQQQQLHNQHLQSLQASQSQPSINNNYRSQIPNPISIPSSASNPNISIVQDESRNTIDLSDLEDCFLSALSAQPSSKSNEMLKSVVQGLYSEAVQVNSNAKRNGQNSSLTALKHLDYRIQSLSQPVILTLIHRLSTLLNPTSSSNEAFVQPIPLGLSLPIIESCSKALNRNDEMISNHLLHVGPIIRNSLRLAGRRVNSIGGNSGGKIWLEDKKLDEICARLP